ncbi:MAG: 2-oxoacid:acceptor oxidoreductase family protein [Thermoplasmata archaeon]
MLYKSSRGVEDKGLFTVIIGGKAGQGVKKAGEAVSKYFLKKRRYAFEMDDYQSLIRGGHNFVSVSSSTHEIFSHHMKAEVLVNLDKRSYDTHREHLAPEGMNFFNSDEVKDGRGIGIPLTEMSKEFKRPGLILGVAGISILTAVTGENKEFLRSLVEEIYPRGKQDNTEFSEMVYDDVVDKIDRTLELKEGDCSDNMFTGNTSVALGGAAAGLDLYFAYPMTPASTILHFYASHGEKFGVTAVHPESEIAVANMAIGATIAGARSMVGTSGGGFALMAEAFSLAGMIESPVLFVLSSRPGPATGAPTYTEQGDLGFALHQGHGDFPRIVVSPGDMREAFYLTADMLSLVWKYQVPGILLTEKHLSESSMCMDVDPSGASTVEPRMHEGSGEYNRYSFTDDGISPLAFPPSQGIIKWNGEEHDPRGLTTSSAEGLAAMHEKRDKKRKAICDDIRKRRSVNVYGSGENVIFTYGSTTLSVREALRCSGIEAKVVQPIYLRPLPTWELKKHVDDRSIVVEQSVAQQFSTLLEDKIGLEPKSVIKQYDGRPFEPVELAEKIQEAIR